ncbi:MAG: hypothetical protein E7588_03365 [Ruminococcaceae bacterium]|nr:hypothetical protein [Oscillospiraceae bacterium]
MDKKLILHVDCTKEYNKENYFEIGTTAITGTSAGRYRETDGAHLSRFGYRFMLENKDKPHLIVVKYPDDKERFMCVTNDSSYDLDSGITCGGVNAVSGKMLESEIYFYPRWQEETVVFTSWGKNCPAAVSEFSVYEIDGFNKAELSDECYKTDRRSFGIQYEDPCNVGLSVGAKNLNEFIERHIEYMKFSGRSHLTYPVNWYHGPIVPVECQPSSRFILVGMQNRKRYIVARKNNIDDWLEYWLTRFDEEGFTFKGSMTLMRLGRLMQGMNADSESVKNGADTYNNVLFNGEIQQSLNDWTAVFNPITFESWYDSFTKGIPMSFAYGEQRPQKNELSDSVRVPIFNPLHPVVQNQVLELLEELCKKYAKHPSFKGLSVNMWHGTMLWYGNLLAGYDDVSTGMFENETGISLGISPDDPKRFEKRHIKLTMTLRDAFINWRCKKIHEFICRCRDTISAVRSDLTLTLTLWNETSASYGYLNTVPGALTGYGARRSFDEIYKEGGIDLRLYGNEKNIEIAIEKTSTRDQSENALRGEEFTNMFVDTAFLDENIAKALQHSKNSTAFIFDSWVEMWGRTVLEERRDDDTNIAALSHFEFGDTDFIAQENSYYADDTQNKFWFDSQMRITSAFPSGHYLEWLANEIAVHDALEVTQGGLYMDMAHAKEQLSFAAQYRKLPKCKFKTLDGETGIVVVRYLEKDGKTYIYAVNREPYTVETEIKTNGATYKMTLGKFELKSEILDAGLIPYSYTVEIPSGIEECYISDVKKAINKIEESFEKGFFAAGAEELKERMSNAVVQRNFSFIRHALKSQIMNNVYKLLSKK